MRLGAASRKRLRHRSLLPYSGVPRNDSIIPMNSPTARPAPQAPMPYVQAIQRALALFEMGRTDEAEHLCRGVLESRPRDFNALHILGVCANARRRYQDAIRLLGRALDANPASYEALVSRGNALKAMDRFEDSIASYDKALAVKPDYADAFCNRGNARQALGSHAAAIDDYDRAIALQPDLADAYSNRGSALLALNRHQEAIEDYSKAIAIRPDFAEAYANRGYALQALDRHHEAIVDCDRATAIRPRYAEANWIKSHSLLCYGLSETGLQLCEQRLSTKKYGILRDYGVPLLGQASPEGKNLLVQWEQRFGDIIQMLRYVPLLERISGACYWQIQEPLRALVTRTFPDIRQVDISECPSEAQYRIPFTSLPLVLRTFSEQAIPVEVPYLIADLDTISAWQRQFQSPHALPTIGIVWSGNPEPPNRSVPIEYLVPILRMPGLRFVALQRELRDADATVLKQFPDIMALGDKLHSFDDNAAVIAAVDLVITIDTAIAHLAGALGKPTWLLLKFGADWRWMLNREDSPWYPTARLFRQPTLGAWGNVIQRVQAALTARFPVAER
jgi:tetratricopeptide (TPR) repeat protein